MAESTDNKRPIASFLPGQFLFKQNERSRDLYILKSGRVRIFKAEGDTTIELDTVLQGGVVGEVAAIDGGPRSASAVALDAVQVYVISFHDFQHTLSQIPDWFYKISRILVQRLREVDLKIDASVTGEKTSAVAAILSCMLRKCPNGILVRSEAENELMGVLSVNRSDAVVALDGLRKRGIIDLTRETVSIASQEKLEECTMPVFADASQSPVT